MTRYELFTMIYYVLDYYWDQNQGEELGNYLSHMSPQLLNGLPKKIGLTNVKFIWNQNIKQIKSVDSNLIWLRIIEI